ncbi:hypothetical protein LSTR_LSTR013827 [Laodelphax striatellus]|uniref:CABIT domain-containing protein n=1 Tax=Laodelphax striatellus TaxID=195883 RepID=A0A482XRW6_LAOST|nr:hypothetical protein LSTR_LSTR013827 [Laodelphax striatellus]
MAAIVDLRSLDSGISYCRTSSSLHSYSSAVSTNTTDNERLTPRTFLERYSLPRVVKIVAQEPVDETERGGLMSLLSGELLMYQQYRSGKVEASSLTKSKNGERIVSSVVIPDTYQGWFSVVTERHQVKARCYNSIQRLVSARVTIFLTMSEVVGYTQNNCRTNSGGMRQQYSKMVLKCGSVLKLLAVYQDITSESTARSKRLSWPLIGRHETNRYAQCLSSNDQVVFISVTQHGQFYAVATASGMSDDTVSKVYQLPKLLRTFPLPVRVCIVTPNKPQGSMLLESYRKEDVILTCLLDSCADVPACMQQTSEDGDDQGGVSNTHFRLLEMDVDSKFYVVKLGPRELDEKRLFHSGLVQRGLRFCRENHEAWARQLKFIHHIYPRNCEDVPAVVPKKNSGKPTRKISLGDKKTVKSASFRFSTSFPEDLRPVKHPVPRKPNPKLRKNEPRTFVESAPSNDTSYYNHDEEFYNEIYSNVPDADNYVNYRENNKNLKDVSVERVGAVNNSIHEGLGYVHYSNRQEVEQIDNHQRGYEELITFQSNKKVDNSKLNDEMVSKNKHSSSNTNESSRMEENTDVSFNNALESSMDSDVVTGDYRARGSERRIESSENGPQQVVAFGKNSPVDSKKSSMISSQSSYYCYNKTVEDVGRNFSKLMLFNDRQSSVKSKTSVRESDISAFKGERFADNKPVSKNFDARASYKDFERTRMDRSGVSGKLELSRAGRSQESYSNEDRKEHANRNLADEKYFADDISDNTRSNMFPPASRSSDNSQALNRGDFLETSHRTVWASPVLAESSTKECASLESGADANQHKLSSEVGSVKLSASPLRVGRPFSTGIKPPRASIFQNKVVGEFETKIKRQLKPAPVVPRTRIRTAQQRDIKVVEQDNSGSSRNPPVFVSTAMLHASSPSPRAADRPSLASFEALASRDATGMKMNELKDNQDGDIKGSKNSSELGSGQILRSSRRSESRQMSSDPLDQKFSSTHNQPRVIERRNIDQSDQRRVRKEGALGHDKIPEIDSQPQSRHDSDEVTNSRIHSQSGSKRYENSRVSVLHDSSKFNRSEESVSKLSDNSNRVDVNDDDRKTAIVPGVMSGADLHSANVSRNEQKQQIIDDNWSLKNENDFKTKIMIEDCRYGVIGAKNAGKPSESGSQKVGGDDTASERTVSPMYRVVRKPLPCPNIIKPFYKTRVQIGPDFSSSTDVPYSVVVDHISTATDVGSTEENIYAEIAGDSYQSPSRYFSFACERRKLTSRYDYRANGGSDGTFSNTTTSSSNADESSV